MCAEIFFRFILKAEDITMIHSNESPFLQKPDYVVCTCMGVMCSEIEDAIDQGCTTFESLSDRLMVGTGCNSCVAEIEDMLVRKVAQK